MIKIKKVDKYFNRYRRNQIHVINNTDLEFKASGLVALLGPSGCGKTTLLNVIGGLDKVDKGAIYLNNKKLTRFSDNAIDNLRNLNIGYIFQDYHLIDDLTVFDNVALALKMVGIKDKEELKSRVNYSLQAVGLYRYRNRYTDMLSGGERQRVAIARAIVKDPKIIIADEPTGNLDSRNTIEVMKIIKAISKYKLVIMVTHEKKLADFYASRIIKIKDGKVISDMINDHEDELDYRIDQKIYLQDIPYQQYAKVGNLDVKYYGDTDQPMALTIVVKNNNLYVQGSEKQRIENVSKYSIVELIDDHYRKITKGDEGEEFDMDKAKRKHYRLRYRSIFNPFTTVISGFKKILNYSNLRKILLLAFFVSAMLVTYSLSSIVATFKYDDSYFVTVNQQYVTYKNNLSVDDYLALRDNPLVKDVVIGDTLYYFNFPLGNFYQSQNEMNMIKTSLTEISVLDKTTLVSGRMPENDHEVVVDRIVISNFELDSWGAAKQAGWLNESDFLGKVFQHSIIGDLTIVGICDQKSPSVYLSKNLYTNLLANNDNGYYEDRVGYEYEEKLYDYNYAKDLKLKKGRWPKNDYEVIVNYDNRFEMKLKKKIDYRVNNKKLKVVGYYKSGRGSTDYYVNENMLLYQLIARNNTYSLITNDKVTAIEELRTQGINVTDTYEDEKNRYLEGMKDNINSTLALSGIMIAVCIVEVYLVIRASFLARIKEVGVYRAIGMKKFDILKMFLGEILAISVTCSFTGVGFMYYILVGMKDMPYLSKMFAVGWEIASGALAGLLLINIVFGLLPVYLVIRKKPAAILSRSDV